MEPILPDAETEARKIELPESKKTIAKTSVTPQISKVAKFFENHKVIIVIAVLVIFAGVIGTALLIMNVLNSQPANKTGDYVASLPVAPPTAVTPAATPPTVPVPTTPPVSALAPADNYAKSTKDLKSAVFPINSDGDVHVYFLDANKPEKLVLNKAGYRFSEASLDGKLIFGRNDTDKAAVFNNKGELLLDVTTSKPKAKDQAYLSSVQSHSRTGFSLDNSLLNYSIGWFKSSCDPVECLPSSLTEAEYASQGVYELTVLVDLVTGKQVQIKHLTREALRGNGFSADKKFFFFNEVVNGKAELYRIELSKAFAAVQEADVSNLVQKFTTSFTGYGQFFMKDSANGIWRQSDNNTSNGTVTNALIEIKLTGSSVTNAKKILDTSFTGDQFPTILGSNLFVVDNHYFNASNYAKTDYPNAYYLRKALNKDTVLLTNRESDGGYSKLFFYNVASKKLTELKLGAKFISNGRIYNLW